MPIKIKNDGAWVEVGSSSGVKTYDLSVEQTGGTDADPALRLTDGSTNDDITITGSGSVTVTRNTATQLTIDGASGGNDYNIPVYGTGNGTSGIRLLKNGSDHDSVSIFGQNGLKVEGNATDGFNGTALIIKTVSGEDVGGKTYTLKSVQDVTNVNLRLNDGTTDDDVLLTAGAGITLDSVTESGFTISTNSNAGNTYDLTVEQTGDPATDANPILRLGDGTTNDDITLTGSGSVSISRTSGTEITITGSAAGGLSLGASVTDILDLTGSTLSADDAGADKIVFWDDDPGKLTYLTVGNGLAISETEITATGTASFSVPGSNKQVLFNDGTFLAAASTLEYDKAGTGTLIKTGNYIRCTKSGGADLVDITEDGGVEIKRTSDTAGPFIDFKSTGSDADARIQMDRTAGDNFSSIKFYTNGFSSERLRIGKAGEIGIAGANYGTTGQVLTSGGDGASVSWAASGGGTAETIAVSDEALTLWMDIVFSSGASASEYLRVNDASGVANSLQVRASDGAVRVKGDITAFRGSDRRLKDNISPIKNALAKVSSISGNTFTWNEKSTDDKQGNDDTGVIAQEITALELPGVTTTRDDGTQAVMYEKLVPLLIEAIKELKEEVDELKSRS